MRSSAGRRAITSMFIRRPISSMTSLMEASVAWRDTRLSSTVRTNRALRSDWPGALRDASPPNKSPAVINQDNSRASNTPSTPTTSRLGAFIHFSFRIGKILDHSLLDDPQHIDEEPESRCCLEIDQEGDVNKFICAQETIRELTSFWDNQRRTNTAWASIGILQYIAVG